MCISVAVWFVFCLVQNHHVGTKDHFVVSLWGAVWVQCLDDESGRSGTSFADASWGFHFICQLLGAACSFALWHLQVELPDFSMPCHVPCVCLMPAGNDIKFARDGKWLERCLDEPADQFQFLGQAGRPWECIVIPQWAFWDHEANGFHLMFSEVRFGILMSVVCCTVSRAAVILTIGNAQEIAKGKEDENKHSCGSELYLRLFNSLEQTVIRKFVLGLRRLCSPTAASWRQVNNNAILSVCACWVKQQSKCQLTM